jgi:hypothetical protein
VQRLLRFFKGALLPDFNIVEQDLLIMGVQQLEDIFCIVLTNMRALGRQMT